ncbi:MAG: class I SAM-dependent methyltransferase, partial [Bryobacteraceae bacterium]
MGHDAPRDARRYLNRGPLLEERRGWYHSFELPDGSVIEGVQELALLRERWARFPIPERLDGKRVLDIGAWDGWFSFEAERRGARVTAVDCVEIPNFLEMHRRLRSQVDYRILDLYEIPEAGLGTFDYVLLLGVLYHVKHPLAALELVCSLTTDTAIVDSFVIDGDTWREHPEAMPVMEFYETDELGEQLDNWFGPSVACLAGMCRAAGFARVDVLHAKAAHAAVACHRLWEPERNEARPPELVAVSNTRTQGINFNSRREEYATFWFASEEEDLTRDRIRAEIGGFGVPALWLRRRDDGGWMANTRIPPGLGAGWQWGRVRTARSGFGAGCRIAVDLPARATALAVRDISDGLN